MAKIKIHLNGTDYNIDESALADVINNLKTHFSTTMSGTGASIEFDDATYNIDAAKLSTATSNFISHLGTIAGSGEKVVVNGVEYGVDSSKISGALTNLTTALENMIAAVVAGLYKTGSDYTELLMPWDELISTGIFAVKNGVLSEGIVLPDNIPEMNEYGFYFGVPYTSDILVATFNQDTSFIVNGSSYPAGQISYSVGSINASAMGIGIGVVSNDGMSITFADADIDASLGEPGRVSDGELKLSTDGSITSIKEGLFKDHSGLTDIEVPASVTTIGERAFSGCTNLTNISFANNSQLETIGEFAFDSCSSLKSIKIPASVNNIVLVSGGGFHGSPFQGCSALESIIVQEGNTNYFSKGNCLINNYGILISGCKNSIIPADGSVKIIDGYAFHNITGLTSIEIPEGVTQIDNSAFKGCTGLESVIIPKGIKSIGHWAFNNCTKLNTIVFTGTVQQWNNINKWSGWNDECSATYVQCSDGQVTL